MSEVPLYSDSQPECGRARPLRVLPLLLRSAELHPDATNRRIRGVAGDLRERRRLGRARRGPCVLQVALARDSHRPLGEPCD